MAKVDFKHPKTWLAATLLLLLALVPVYVMWAGQSYYLTLFARIMIYALAALSLNFILGFGGLASLGHALYLGIGAYGVSILQFHGVTNGWVQLGASLFAGLLFAAAVGSVVVRLTGMTFIMITLAFAQMGYFLAVTLKQYGGEDGRSIDTRSAMGIVDLSNNTTLYFTIFACLIFALWLFSWLVDSRFGMVLRGCKSNERRMLALGFPTYRYKLVAYVISALVCVVAGFLLANLTLYVSPSYMQWTISADLIIMVVLGGMSTLFGPVVGAVTFLVLEEVLSSFKPGLFPGVERLINDHWLAVVGTFVIVVVLTAKQGIYGWVASRSAR
jgi:branched-chain amino acid transport system permease protein